VELVERFANIAESADSVEDAVRNATMVINATPIGMLDDHQPVPVNALSRRAIVIDLVYRPGGTTWVNLARGNGHIAADGKVMLLAQGAAAFERWFGIRPDVRAMRQAIA
jgi:shikimate dehydrogenase